MIKVNGTLINYYFHCKRQCYLSAHKLNLEDNSELVKIGKAIHEKKLLKRKDSELSIENIKIDKITSKYIVEVKKSDADIEATKWQLIFYLKILKDKGIIRKGKIEFLEVNEKNGKKNIYIELNKKLELELESHIKNIKELIEQEKLPTVTKIKGCKNCAYYEYCYI